jgi:hypothetical protein
MAAVATLRVETIDDLRLSLEERVVKTGQHPVASEVYGQWCCEGWYSCEAGHVYRFARMTTPGVCYLLAGADWHDITLAVRSILASSVDNNTDLLKQGFW